jgi:2-polyprenyl-3-methyl-5-hydroxy-6-metoxy-1,4-benzoquinol methylase
MAQKEEWNQRYSAPDFIYGIEPNEFLKRELPKIPVGKILFPGDGEGRNALWAAKQGWDVSSFDFSEEAVKKSNLLFAMNGVNVNCLHSSIETFNTTHQFDVIALIYIHLPSELRAEACNRLIEMLNPKGRIILECFHPDQLGNFSGGPKNPDLFPTMEELRSSFSSLTLLSLRREEIELNEGPFHQGKAIVIRMIAEK